MTIKEARQKAGFSQSEVCALLEIPLRTYQNWEQNKRVPATWLAKLIVAEILRHTPKDF